MSEAHFFSNLCFYFSVHDVDAYLRRFGPEEKISEEKLRHAEFFKAADWLSRNLSRFQAHMTQLKKPLQDGVRLLKWGDCDYPENLKTLSFPPPLLFVRGIFENQKPRVAIVGARNPTHIGRLWVQNIVPKLVEAGIEIVSGGARGIDAEAHWASLQCKGSTVAFLPGAVENPYPLGNKIIFDKILQSGALFSEYALGTSVRAENFHRRNRLIAGLADLTVIVEAGQKSGTLMTATKAISENREILVVPGPPLVTSYAGSLDLIYNGAGLARDEKDIIFSLGQKNVLKKKQETPTLGS